MALISTQSKAPNLPIPAARKPDATHPPPEMESGGAAVRRDFGSFRCPRSILPALPSTLTKWAPPLKPVAPIWVHQAVTATTWYLTLTALSPLPELRVLSISAAGGSGTAGKTFINRFPQRGMWGHNRS